MFLRRAALGVFLCCWATTAAAQWWPSEPASGEGAAVVILHRGETHLDLRLTVPGIHVGEPDERGHVSVVIPSEGTLDRVGQPAVPTVSRWIAVPAGASVWAEVITEDVERLSCDPVTPRQPPRYRSGPVPPFAVDEEVYRAAAAVPGAGVTVGQAGRLRRQGIVRLQLQPVRYLPRAGELEVALTQDVRVHFDGGELPAHGDGPTFTRLLDRWVIGAPGVRATAPDVPESMLVIASSELEESIEPLVQWKNRRGVQVSVLTMDLVGSTSAEVRRAIADAYEASDPPLTYVLLVGDETHVPVLHVNAGDHDGEGESDFLYSLTEGDDSIPDVLIGRLPARTSEQLRVMVNRIIRYERDVGRSGPDGFTVRATGIGSAGVGSFDPDYVRMERIVSAMEGYGYSQADRFFEGQWSSADQLVDAVDQGRGWVCFMGHGSGVSWHFDQDTSFTFGVDHIEQLDNGQQWPVVVDVACNNGDFTHHEPCFAEAWLRAGTVADPLGAVGIYSSSISAAWDEPAEMEEGIVYSFLDDREAVWGEAILGGLLHMEAFFGASDTVEEVKRTFIDFGDPSLQVRSKVPANLVVEHEHTVAPGPVELQVEVLDDSDAPVQDAVVALSKGSALRAVALTDDQGLTLFELDLADGEALDVVVTGFDLVTYEGVVVAMDIGGGDDDDSEDPGVVEPGDDDGGPEVEIGSGCACRSSASAPYPGAGLVLVLVLLGVWRRRGAGTGGQEQ